jgi:hypothetical protein
MTTYTGGCHCGRIRFEVIGELTRVTECNCSICAKSGFLHWRVEPEQVRLLTPKEGFSTYLWHTREAKHHFCPVCGVAPLRNPRRDPTKISVNARCLDNVDLSRVEVVHFDGRNWD